MPLSIANSCQEAEVRLPFADTHSIDRMATDIDLDEPLTFSGSEHFTSTNRQNPITVIVMVILADRIIIIKSAF